MAKTIKIKYVRSVIGGDKRQRETVRCLGLSRLGQVREVVDNPQIRGAIRKVAHLVEVLNA